FSRSPVAFRCLHVPKHSIQVSDHDFPSHLPDLITQVVYKDLPIHGPNLFAQVVGQFTHSQLPYDVCMYLCLLSDQDFLSHLLDMSAKVVGQFRLIFSLFPVTFRCFHVLVLSVQLSDQDFLSHLLDMSAKVVGQFPPFLVTFRCLQFPRSPIAFRCLHVPAFSTQVSDHDFPSHLSDLSTQVPPARFHYTGGRPGFAYPPARFVCTGGSQVSLFLVAFKSFHVPVFSLQVSGQDLPIHLPDLAAHVVGLFTPS
ncbi:unnamed protein product, partial [Prunus brigantina]